MSKAILLKQINGDTNTIVDKSKHTI